MTGSIFYDEFLGEHSRIFATLVRLIVRGPISHLVESLFLIQLDSPFIGRADLEKYFPQYPATRSSRMRTIF
jgi:hypothetical protein